MTTFSCGGWLVAKSIVRPFEVLSNIWYLRAAITVVLFLPSTYSSCVWTGTQSSSPYLPLSNVSEPVSLSVCIITHLIFHVGRYFVAYSNVMFLVGWWNTFATIVSYILHKLREVLLNYCYLTCTAMIRNKLHMHNCILIYLNNEVQHPFHEYSGVGLFLVPRDIPTDIVHYQSIWAGPGKLDLTLRQSQLMTKFVRLLHRMRASSIIAPWCVH